MPENRTLRVAGKDVRLLVGGEGPPLLYLHSVGAHAARARPDDLPRPGASPGAEAARHDVDRRRAGGLRLRAAAGARGGGEGGVEPLPARSEARGTTPPCHGPDARPLGATGRPRPA